MSALTHFPEDFVPAPIGRLRNECQFSFVILGLVPRIYRLCHAGDVHN